MNAVGVLAKHMVLTPPFRVKLDCRVFQTLGWHHKTSPEASVDAGVTRKWVNFRFWANYPFNVPLFHFILCCRLFDQARLSEEIRLISAFLRSLTDDSTSGEPMPRWTNKPVQMLPDPMGSCLHSKQRCNWTFTCTRQLTYPSTLHYPPRAHPPPPPLPSILYLQQIHNNETGDFHAAVRTDLILAGWMIAIGFASSDN